MDTSVSQTQPSSLLRKATLLIACVLLLVILAAWLVPKTIALYQQMKAGKIINGISQINNTNTPNDLPCARAALTNSQEIDQVQIAIKRLSLALKLDSHFAKAQFLLGQAYCLTGEANSAVTAFEKYNQLRPRNPLGHIELALAIEYRCLISMPSSGSTVAEKVNRDISFPYCRTETDTGKVIDEWKAAGVQPSQLAGVGNYNFKNKNYDVAIRWYQRSLLLEPTNNQTINDLGII
ncbi:MAG: tetratricopeptide repeat protein, partial [Omnitrophica WOR_2 bacterium]